MHFDILHLQRRRSDTQEQIQVGNPRTATNQRPPAGSGTTKQDIRSTRTTTTTRRTANAPATPILDTNRYRGPATAMKLLGKFPWLMKRSRQSSSTDHANQKKGPANNKTRTMMMMEIEGRSSSRRRALMGSPSSQARTESSMSLLDTTDSNSWTTDDAAWRVGKRKRNQNAAPGGWPWSGIVWHSSNFVLCPVLQKTF